MAGIKRNQFDVVNQFLELFPIEIKFGVSTRLKQVTALTRFVQQQQLPFGIVINQAREVRMLSDHIIQIPASVI